MMINNPATARFKSSPVLGAVVVFVDEAGVSGLITGVSLGVSILTSLVHKWSFTKLVNDSRQTYQSWAPFKISNL